MELYGLNGRFSVSASIDVTNYKNDVNRKKAYGYLYLENKESDDVLMDFNREKDVPFIETSSTLPLPAGTYDMFSVSAQGIGGTYRTYRNDFPMFHDDVKKQNFTKKGDRKKLLSTSLGAEIGATKTIKFGINGTFIFNNSYSGIWRTNNNLRSKLDLVKSVSNKPEFEPSYFKMTDEFSPIQSSTINDIGGKNLMVTTSGLGYLSSNVKQYYSTMAPNSYAIKPLPTSPLHYANREKRNKLISYLNAEEATLAALDKMIPIMKVDLESESPKLTAIDRIDNYIRQPHHLSEITVTGEDGQRFVYGIPAYNRKYIEKSFAIGTSTVQETDGQIIYGTGDNTTANNKGTDNFFTSKELPPYSHSFLLTAVLSPDYIDLQNDGISDDDLGTAIKFSYRLPNHSFRWRVPYLAKHANYQQGNKTTTLDDKASYIYGEKEVWHIREIEGKNHIAVFELAERHDGFGVIDEHGGLLDSMKSYMLKKITLFAKMDYRKNGSAAYPIKTVNFVYDYTLCNKVENNEYYTNSGITVKGKLSLKSLYFTYGRSNKGRLSPYVFNYSNVNPSYNLKGSDRWGTYKPNWGVYGSLSGHPNNAEYPYTIQNKDSANAYASAWCLTEITLPSGGKIKVTYESDDYAYVQDKKAMHMFQIEGLTQNLDLNKSNLTNFIFRKKNISNYELVPKPQQYLYFKLEEDLSGTDKNERFRKLYLNEQNTIQFNLLALVSGSKEAYEYVKIYADINPARSGVTNDGKSGYLYIIPVTVKSKNSESERKVNPIAKGIWQFIRTQVPYQLYPMSDRNRKYDGSKDRGTISTIKTAFSKLSKIFSGGIENFMYNQGYGSKIIIDKSWVRLTDPNGVKYGGGHRVRRITMDDNWANMSNDNGAENQNYGQEYIYQTRDTILNRTISSGVAAYEPGIGCDENPFRMPSNTVEDLKWAPDLIHSTDEPIGESYSPAPIVGYSEVKVIPLIPEGIIKQQTGYTLNTFYTAKEFPFKVINSPISKDKIEPTFGSFFDKKIYHTTVSQGYLIETNDMHGKAKEQLIFNSKGNRVSGSKSIYAFDSNNPNQLNNSVKTIKNDGTISNAEFGVTVDFYSDTRESTSKTFTCATQFNFDMFNVGIYVIPIPTLFFFPKKEDRIFQTAVVVKHINRMGILQKTIAYQENAAIVTENLMYDYETGQVLLTSVQNEFKENIYNFTYPAHWAYDKGMGAGYKNTGLVLENVNFVSGIPKFSSQNLNSYLVSGDLCLVYKPSVSIPEIMNAYVGQDGIINFIDFYGNPFSDANSSNQYRVKVIRSGRRNLQSTPIGTVTTLKNPIKSGYLEFDSLLNSSAVEYSDNWKINCNQINTQSWVCQDNNDLTSAFNLILLANYQSGGKKYQLSVDSILRYDVGSFKSLITPDQVYDSSNLMRTFFNDTCRNRRGNPSYFDVRNTPYNPGSPSSIEYSSYVERYKTAYRRIFNTSSDSIWKASLGDRFDLFYKIYPEFCGCHSLSQSDGGLIFRLYAPYIVSFKNILHFKNVKTFRNYLLPGSINEDYQFKVTAVMNDSTDVEFTGYGYCDFFRFNCQKSCNELAFGQITNPFQAGIKGNWRKVKDYAFSADRRYQTSRSAPKRDATYESSQYTNFWKKNSSISEATGSYYSADKSNEKWVWTNEVTIYSPNGPELENKNALDIYSSALYGFRYSLPLAVASNAKYRQIGYESFEDASSLIECEKGHFSFMKNLGTTAKLDINNKHSGKTSIKVKRDSTYVNIVTIEDTVSEEFNKEEDSYYNKSKTDCIGTFQPDSGYYLVSAWVKDSVSVLDTTYDKPDLTIEVVKSGTTSTYQFKATGLIIDGWQRIEGKFKIPSETITINFKLNASPNNCSWFDDIRVHPIAGNMKTYAYDPITFRLMADLDENNYASFYEYDFEGNLARMKRETERGIVTIKETKSSIKGD